MSSFASSKKNIKSPIFQSTGGGLWLFVLLGRTSLAMLYRDNSLIRNSASLGPYSGPKSRGLRICLGGLFLMSEVPLYRAYRGLGGGCRARPPPHPKNLNPPLSSEPRLASALGCDGCISASRGSFYRFIKQENASSNTITCCRFMKQKNGR